MLGGVIRNSNENITAIAVISFSRDIDYLKDEAIRFGAQVVQDIFGLGRGGGVLGCKPRVLLEST